MSVASARKFIIRCRCICRNASTTWAIGKATCRRANKRRGKRLPCRCSRNSPAPSRATWWSRFRTFIRDRRFWLFKRHRSTRAFTDLAAVWPTAFFRRHASQLALAILDLTQLPQDCRLFFHVFILGKLAAFQPQLQLEQPLFDRRVVGVLFLRDSGQRAEDELHAVNGHEQKIINQ